MKEKDDRRSQRTRQALGDALVALMMESSYDSISIKDVIERANVGRSTFYSHYAYKDELLADQLEHLLDMLARHFPQEDLAGNPFFPSLGLFKHIQMQSKLYQSLVGSSGMDVFTRYMEKFLSQKVEQHLRSEGHAFEVPVPIAVQFLIGSFLYLLKWWLDNKMMYAPEQMDEMYRKLALPGVIKSGGTD